jgi:hypothetical protein
MPLGIKQRSRIHANVDFPKPLNLVIHIMQPFFILASVPIFQVQHNLHATFHSWGDLLQ